jgi:hypothetical protein
MGIIKNLQKFAIPKPRIAIGDSKNPFPDSSHDPGWPNRNGNAMSAAMEPYRLADASAAARRVGIIFPQPGCVRKTKLKCCVAFK